MIKKHTLSDFLIDFNSDFAIYGNGESGADFQYNPEKIKIFAINQAVRFTIYQKKTIDVSTFHEHIDYNCKYLKDHYPGRDFNLIGITLKDISKHHLPSGETANQFVHYLVHQMKKFKVRDKKIYLTGFDFSYSKPDNWNHQIQSLKYSQIMAEYNNIDIICTSDNNRLSFLKHERPLEKFLVQPKKKLS